MTAQERQRWQQVRAIFDEAADADSSEGRSALLAERCGADSGLRDEVERLLEQEERQDLVLDTLRDAVAPRRRKAGDLVAGRWRLTRFLASGGMGEVFAARDEAEGGVGVALKFVKPGPSDVATAEIRARFRREAHLMAGLRHPNICRLLDYVEASSEEAFCVMELVEGETLAAVLEREGRLTPERAKAILVQMCAGLAAAHQEGVLHRDLKPGNVLVEPGGRVVLIDFGLAAAAAPGAHETLTAAGAVIGTLAYMAPEQMEDGVATAASDLYAVGAIAFEMLTGAKPYAAPSPLKLAIERARDSADRTPRRKLNGLPALWRETIGRCLRRNPAARFRSALELRQRLECGRATPGFWLSRPLIAAPLLLWMLALLGIGVWDWWQADYVPRPETRELYLAAQAALVDAVPDRAAELLHRAVAVEPEFLKAGALLAVAEFEAGRAEAARTALLRAVVRRSARWHIGRGEALWLDAAQAAVMGEPATAAAHFRQLAEGEPDGVAARWSADRLSGEVPFRRAK